MDLRNEPWYRAGSLAETKALVKSEERGHYIVWDGTGAANPVYVVLVSEGNGECSAYKVPVQNGKCVFASKTFESVPDLVKFVRSRALRGKNGGSLRLRRKDDQAISNAADRATQKASTLPRDFRQTQPPSPAPMSPPTSPFSRSVPKPTPAQPVEMEIVRILRRRGGRLGMSLQKKEDHLEVQKLEANTDAADATPPISVGTKIFFVNNVPVADSQGVREAFRMAKQIELKVQGPQGKMKAIFIAPLDAKAFDKLDVRITSPAEIPPHLRGKDLNRYWDILPSPLTQVKLRDEGDPKSSYINANFVRSFGGRRMHEYIAAQGPLPDTVESFVRMIWEKKITVVIQATGFEEKGVTKCEHYVPLNEGESLSVGRYYWEVTSKEQKKGYAVTMQKLSCNGETRKVCHVWFNSWPDHGVPSKPNGAMDPENAVAMLLEVRKIRNIMDKNEAPLLVHCSAGVGRTGTLIIIDQVITALSLDTEVDLLELIECIRQDRMALVQHTIQYKFAYQACVYYAQEFAAGKGMSILARDSKKGDGLRRARRESMKMDGAYKKVVANGVETFQLRTDFTVTEEEGDAAGFRGSNFDESTESKIKKIEEEYEKNVGLLPLEKQPWFRTGFTRAQVEELLEEAPKGTFVVRESGTHEGCFTLSMVTEKPGSRVNNMLLIPVQKVENGKQQTYYKSGRKGDRLFPSVVNLVEFHMKHSGIKAHSRGKSYKIQLTSKQQADVNDSAEC
eukprot:m.6794 g.6794  ORF g.6794 m.6794 type:complete len:734 (+) comp3586_c0_seq1:168-2369(+)